MTESEFEIVVVGAGPAGVAAASVAAEHGKRVALLDETPWLGGQIWRGQARGIAPAPGAVLHARVENAKRPANRPDRTPEARVWLDRLAKSGAKVFDRTTVISSPRPGALLAESAEGPREISWQKLIITTGARELFLPFPGWTTPGVTGPGGLLTLVKNGWPVAGNRVVIAGTGPLLLAAADGLQAHGAQIVGICEQAPWPTLLEFGFELRNYPRKLMQAAGLFHRLLGIPVHAGAWPIAVEGENQVESVTLTNGESKWQVECDLLATGFGLVPNVELAALFGCELHDGFVRVDSWQATSAPQIFCAGEPTGIGGADCALVEGEIAGLAAAGDLAGAESRFDQRASWHRFRTLLASAFALRPELKSLASEETLICRCEDVTLGQVRRFHSWREAKLHSRCGMGSCQGRVCGAVAKTILGWTVESVRPPILPARIESLIANRER